MKKTIKIDYLDFGDDCTQEVKEHCFFTRLLRTKYDVVVTRDADYAFYSTYGCEKSRFDGIRIFYTGENIIPNFNHCDYAIAFARLNFADRYFRFPLWCMKEEMIKLAETRGVNESDEELLNRDFCATVISNAKQTDGIRETLFEKLSVYRPLASGGKYKNNVGGRVKDKIAFQKKYKFTLACENTYAPGYTTEKLLDAFASNTIPIYYGDPTAVQDFNPEAFINVHDFKSLDDVVAEVKKIDADDQLYLSKMRARIFRDGKMPHEFTKEALLDFLSNIFDPPLENARRRFYAKPYQDIDFDNMKIRDMKLVVAALFKRFIKEIKSRLR